MVLGLGVTQRGERLTTGEKLAYYEKKKAQAGRPVTRSPPRAIMAGTKTASSLSSVAADPRFGGYGHNKVDKRRRGAGGKGKVGVKKGVGRGRKKVADRKGFKSAEFVPADEDDEDMQGDWEESVGEESMDVDDEDGDEEMGEGNEEEDETGNEGDVEDAKPKNQAKSKKKASRSILLDGEDFADMNYTTSKPTKSKVDMGAWKVTKPKSQKMRSYDPPGEKVDLKALSKKQRDMQYKKMMAEERKQAEKDKPKTPRKTKKGAKKIVDVADDDVEEEEEAEAKVQDSSPATKKVKARPKVKLDMSGVMSRAGVPGLTSNNAKAREPVLMRKTAKGEKMALQVRREALKASDIQSFMKNTFYKDIKNNLIKYNGDLEKMKKNVHGKRNVGIMNSPTFKHVVQKLIDCGDYYCPSLVSPVKVFNVMGLKEEVRNQVWRELVVDQKFFIYPENKSGAEQPDLAMVSNAVRDEVLPLYYEENIFAVELLGNNIEDDKGLGEMKKFADALIPGGWLDHIGHWVFSCTFPEDGPALDDDESIMVSLKIGKIAKSWTIDLEIHKDATCFRKIGEKTRECVPAQIPEWLAQLASLFTEEANGNDRITGDMLVGLGKEIKARADELQELWCT